MEKVKIVNNTIHSAKIFVYKESDGTKSFLILKEPERIYGFVGGAQDMDDETIFATAKRELSEEVGLTEKSCELIETNITYEFVHTDPKSERFGKKGVLHAFIAKYDNSEEIILDKELLGCEWVPVDIVFERVKSSYPYLTDVFKKVIKLIET